MYVYDYNNICSVEKSKKCTSGSVVEYRLAKARVAGSNPVSCLSFTKTSTLYSSRKRAKCTSGSVVEYRLAKARVAGSNPVSCLSFTRNFNFIQFSKESKMHEWLSGGVSPCQGEGRGFESRLVLFLYPKFIYLGISPNKSQFII